MCNDEATDALGRETRQWNDETLGLNSVIESLNPTNPSKLPGNECEDSYILIILGHPSQLYYSTKSTGSGRYSICKYTPRQTQRVEGCMMFLYDCILAGHVFLIPKTPPFPIVTTGHVTLYVTTRAPKAFECELASDCTNHHVFAHCKDLTPPQVSNVIKSYHYLNI